MPLLFIFFTLLISKYFCSEIDLKTINAGKIIISSVFSRYEIECCCEKDLGCLNDSTSTLINGAESPKG